MSSNVLKSFKRYSAVQKMIPLLCVILLVVGVGLHMLSSGHAATPFAEAEAESGTLTGSATIVTDSSASGGKAVQFGSTSSTSQSCTNPTYTIPLDSSNPQGGVTIGNFYVTNDTWNISGYQVAQTVYACNYNNWYVTATMNNNNDDGAVKSYPNVHEDFNEPLISSFHTISSSFSEIPPHVGIYEYAYDMWLNGVASNGSTEVMIWTDNYHQTPAGSQVGTFSDGGQTYTIWKSGSYIAFVDNTNVTSGTVNILDFYDDIINKGWIPSTSTVGQIDYGIELVSTNNQPTNFVVNNFSLTTN